MSSLGAVIICLPYRPTSNRGAAVWGSRCPVPAPFFMFVNPALYRDRNSVRIVRDSLGHRYCWRSVSVPMNAGSRTRAIISFTGDSTLKAPPVKTTIRSSDGTRYTF